MQISVRDDLEALVTAWLGAGAPATWDSYLQGACWALARVSGADADDLEAFIRAHVPPPPPAGTPVGPRLLSAIPGGIAPPVVISEPGAGPVPVAAPNDDAPVLGYYALDPVTGRPAMEVTRLADPLKAADLDHAPAGPAPGSYAEAFESAQAAGDPAMMPLDPETHAAVMAEIARGSEPKYDAAGNRIPEPVWPALPIDEEATPEPADAS